MKSIKKILFTIALVVVCSQSFGYLTLSRKTHGGLFGYYNYTSKEFGSSTGPDGTITSGWFIECSGGGFSSCPHGINVKQDYSNTPCTSPTCVDVIDNNQSADLLDYALTSISNNILTGSYSIQVNVANQQMRVYVVTWNSSDSDGNNSDIQVERTL
jgi:hypothetical protein